MDMVCLEDFHSPPTRLSTAWGGDTVPMACGSTDAHEGMLEKERTAALARGRAPAAAVREAFNMVTIIDKMQMHSRLNDRSFV